MDLKFDAETIRHYDEMGAFRMRAGKKLYRPSAYSELVDRWVEDEFVCPHCGRQAIRQRDRDPFSWHDIANFACASCGAEYYLIRASNSLRSSVQSSYYKGLLEHIDAGDAPDIICLTSDRHTLSVTDLLVIPAQSLKPEYLSPGLKDVPEDQDGWCWVLVGRMRHELGESSIIDLVRDGEIVPNSQA